MSYDDTTLFTRLAAAYVRGMLSTAAQLPNNVALFTTPLEQLDTDHRAALIRLGHDSGLRLHRFKRTMGLPRVNKVLGMLRGMAPTNLLDVGSGRGAFLWPLLEALPDLAVTALDLREQRVAQIQAVATGGISNLTVMHGDITTLDYPAASFDVVTLLEVLEHIPATDAALSAVLRLARHFVIISVPSQPDDNPEHVYLFSAAQLEELLRSHGAARVSFDYVPGHLLAVVRIAS